MKKRFNKRMILVLISLSIILIMLILFFMNEIYFTGFSIFEKIFNPLFLFSSAGRLFINIGYYVSVDSPQNITYNFSIGNNYTLNLNVSSNRNITVWKYTHEDLRHGTIVNNSVVFNPNTTIRAVRWNNRITVFANDSGGNIKNESMEFYVSVPNSPPIIRNVNTNVYVCEGSYLSYLFNISDVDEDVPVATISPSNPFYVSYYINMNLTSNKYEVFSGILNKTNAGGVNGVSKIHNMTIYAIDSQYIDSTNFNITVIEINNAPVIHSINNTAIWTTGNDSSFYYQINASDIEDGDQNSLNLTFNISFFGITLFNISSNGTMRFIPSSSQTGIHNITIYVTDSGLRNPHQNISLCGQNGSNRTSSSEFSLTISDRTVEIISAGGGGGGGSGGGGGAKNCSEKWGCGEWSTCSNLTNFSGNKTFIGDGCLIKNWTGNCGGQIRICQDVNKCKKDRNETRACLFSLYPDCSDEIKNCHDGSCEILTDCGGPCSPCPTCSDKIKNQGEQEIDCGGPCPKCFEIPYEKIEYGSLIILFITILVILTILIIVVIIYFRRRREYEDIKKRRGV